MTAKLNLLVLASLLALFAPFLVTAEEAAVGDAGQAVHVLLFRSYNLGWIRYLNLDNSFQPKLTAAESVVFPYQRYNNGTVALVESDLEQPGAIAALIAAHEIAYDEAAVVGSCDPNKLAPASRDVVCVPGTQGMEKGQIFLALFDPDTGELVALTTAIDNTIGGAVVVRSQPAPVVEAEAGDEPAPDDEPEDSDNCCQLGWQCGTDWQWKNGFYAYQNNQCSAAPHTEQPEMRPRQSSQPRQSNQPDDSREPGDSNQSRQSSPTSQTTQSSPNTRTSPNTQPSRPAQDSCEPPRTPVLTTCSFGDRERSCYVCQ